MVIRKEFIVIASGVTTIPVTSFIGQSGHGDSVYDIREFDTENEAVEYIEMRDNTVSDYQILRKYKDVKIRRK